MQAILLIPPDRGAFHLGETGLDDTSELIHSDTLFSALANTYALALGGAEGFIDHVASARLRFSSSFPALLHDNGTTFFLPRPPIDFPRTERGKKAKALRFLSLGIWQQLCATYDPDKCSCGLDLLAFPLIGNAAFLSEELPPSMPSGVSAPWHIIDYPKVKAHTMEAEDRLYHETILQSIPVTAGEGSLRGAFFFLVEHKLEESAWQDFLAAVRIMADEGIGGQRSTGRGQFSSVELIELGLTGSRQMGHHMGLSLLSPTDDREFREGVVLYETVLRGGGTLGRYGSSVVHRKQALFVREGALFKGEVKGRLVDISPTGDGSVLRNGMNFSIPLGDAS